MDTGSDTGGNDTVEDFTTTPNIKVVARDWLALEAELVQLLHVELSVTGRFPAPGAPILHAPGGAVDRWLECARQREEAAAQMLRLRSSLHPALLPSFYPAFNPLVLHFMAAAIALREADAG
jgi:hypothetical protein